MPRPLGAGDTGDIAGLKCRDLTYDVSPQCNLNWGSWGNTRTFMTLPYGGVRSLPRFVKNIFSMGVKLSFWASLLHVLEQRRLSTCLFVCTAACNNLVAIAQAW